MKILIRPQSILPGSFDNCVGNTDSCGVQSCLIVGCSTNCADDLSDEKEFSSAKLEDPIQNESVCWTYLCTPLHFLPW